MTFFSPFYCISVAPTAKSVLEIANASYSGDQSEYLDTLLTDILDTKDDANIDACFPVAQSDEAAGRQLMVQFGAPKMLAFIQILSSSDQATSKYFETELRTRRLVNVRSHMMFRPCAHLLF